MNRVEKFHADQGHEAHSNTRLHQAAQIVVNEMHSLSDATEQSDEDTLCQYLNSITVPRLHNATERIHWLLTAQWGLADYCLQNVDQLESEYENLAMDWSPEPVAQPYAQLPIWRHVSETVTTLQEQVEPLKTLPDTELNAKQSNSLSVTNDKLQLQIQKLHHLLLVYFLEREMALQTIDREQGQAVVASLLENIQGLDEQANELQEECGHREHRNLNTLTKLTSTCSLISRFNRSSWLCATTS